MDINLLVNLSARAWSLPILAAFASDVPGRQAPLLAATGAGRTAFADSLTHLVELELVRRNPGHGHPLRPEYILTETGQAAAAMAARVLGTLGQHPGAGLIRRSWTLPVLAVAAQPIYFRDIKARIGPVSDRALSQSLRALEEHAWIDRRVEVAQRPPRPVYQAIDLGARVSVAVGLQISAAPPAR